MRRNQKAGKKENQQAEWSRLNVSPDEQLRGRKLKKGGNRPGWQTASSRAWKFRLASF